MDRRAALLSLVAVSACGFAPVYAPGNAASALRGATAFEAPDTVAGFRLRARLEDRLGRSSAPQYNLRVDLDIGEDSVAITPEGDITRVTLPGAARYALTNSDGILRTSGQVNSFTSYSTTGTTVATGAAANDARDRLAIILADLIVTRLTALP